MKTTRQRKTATAVIILIAMLVQITGFGLFSPVLRAGEGTDLGNIFTDVRLSLGKEGDDEGDFQAIDDPAWITIEDKTIIRLDLSWELGDAVELAAGDYATINVPGIFSNDGLADDYFKGFLLDGDIPVGTYELMDNNQLKLIFNDNLVGKTDRAGEVWLGLKFTADAFDDDYAQDIDFSEALNKKFTIIGLPKQDPPKIKKSGDVEPEINPEKINWVIDVNTTLQQLEEGSNVVDNIPEGLSLDLTSITIHELIIGKEKITEGPEITLDPEDNKSTTEKLEIILGKTNKAYKIRFTTDIKKENGLYQYEEEYENTAVLTYAEDKTTSGDFTIHDLVIGSMIEKSGKADKTTDASSITWTIDINKAEYDLQNVKITDLELKEIIAEASASGAVIKIKTDSIEIHELSKSGSDWVLGDKVTEKTPDFTDNIFSVELGDIDSAYRIEFIVDLEYTGEYKGTLNFTNTAKMEYGTETISIVEDTAEVEVKRSPIFGKSGVDATNYGDSKIKWTITVNAAGHKINDAVLTDSFPAGLVLIDGTLQIIPNDIPEDDISINSDKKSFSITLGDIDKKYTITYETKITDHEVPFKELKNDAHLTGTSPYGDGSDSAEIDMGLSKEPTGVISNKYNKAAVGSVDYVNKTMNWRITIDPVKDEILELTITDTFTPGKSMFFLTEGFEVKAGSKTLTDADYTLTAKGVDGFVLGFKGAHKPLERVKYEINFKTSFDPNKVLAEGGVLHEALTGDTAYQYKNSAKFTGKTKNGKDIDIDRSAKFDLNKTIFNGGKKDGTLNRTDRKISWEVYVNALGRDLTDDTDKPFVIVDKLSPGQVFDQDSLVVSTFSLKADGTIEKGDPIAEGEYTFSFADDEEKLTITFAGGIKIPVLVEVDSNIEGVSLKEYKNTVDTFTSTDKPYKKYDEVVEYADHETFVVKKATTGVKDNFAYKDDEIIWELTINESLSEIEAGATVVDTISSGLVLLSDSVMVKKAKDGTPLELNTDYELAIKKESGSTELKITFKKNIDAEKYTINYTTVVVGENKDGVQNNAEFSGNGDSIQDSDDEEYTVSHFSGGTGSGTNRGKLIVQKRSSDNEKLLPGAEFSLYYVIEGDEYYVEDEDGIKVFTTDAQGKLEFTSLLYRTYYLEEVNPPAGYVQDEDLPVELDLNQAEVEIDIYNTPIKTGKWEPAAFKKLIGKDFVREFEFEIRDGSTPVLKGETAGASVAGVKSVAFTLVAGQEAEGLLEFTNDHKFAGDETEYLVATLPLNMRETTTGLSGYELDDEVKTLIVRVYNVKGREKLKVTIEDGKGNILSDDDGKFTGEEVPVFTNHYTASGEINLEGEKIVEGHSLVEGQFEFELYEGDELIETVANEDDGSFVFTSLTYTEGDVGTKEYRIVEKVPADPEKAPGYGYDESEYIVTVTISDEKDNGSLTVSASYMKVDSQAGEAFDRAVFTNKYETDELSVDLSAEKILTGRELEEGQFFFTLDLVEDDDDVIPVNGSPFTHTKDGQISLPTLVFEQTDIGKTFTYQLSEVDEQKPGYEYDKQVYTIVISIFDNDDGTLRAEVSRGIALNGDLTPVDEMVFNNSYKAQGDLVLTAKKDLQGPALEDKQFSFILKTEDGEVLQTVENDSNGDVTFDAIEFNQGQLGDHQFIVAEVQGNKPGIIYDGSEYLVTVQVADNGDGTLDVTQSYLKITNDTESEAEEILFTNGYISPVTELTVTKKWVGGLDNPPVVEVQLYRDGQPYGESVELVSKDRVGSHTWTNLDVTDENGKVYEYTVDELTELKSYKKTVDGFVITNTYEEPEKPVLEKDVNGETELDVTDLDQLLVYAISTKLPADTSMYYRLVLLDDLVDVLEVLDARALVDGVHDKAVSAFVQIDGQTVRLVLEYGSFDFKTIAGKTVTLEIDAKIKADADLTAYVDESIPNQAVLQLNDSPDVKTSNMVIIDPPDIPLDVPKTGENGFKWQYPALMLLLLGGLVVTRIYYRKRAR